MSVISLQTNGTLLDREMIAALETAGLDRINLSLHALDPAIARMLAGADWFDVDRITEAARAVCPEPHRPAHCTGIPAGDQRCGDPEADPVCTGNQAPANGSRRSASRSSSTTVTAGPLKE